ncbi:endonuclease/exonuclease/phosphatase family protein [Phycisphaeraceae bacterium D3-23]
MSKTDPSCGLWGVRGGTLLNSQVRGVRAVGPGLLVAVAMAVCALGLLAGCHGTPVVQPVRLTVVAYNVEFGNRGTAEQVGEALIAYEPDVVAFNEVPGGDWVERAGVVLGMPYCYVGEISSANHKDKYKAVLSRTPLHDTGELVLEGPGWNPASAVRASTRVGGREVVVYALHVSGGAHGGQPRPGEQQSGDLARRAAEATPGALVILAGDFNDRLGEAHMDDCLAAGFRASWQDLGLDVSRASGLSTWNAAGGQRSGVIDHVLYRVPSAMRTVDGGIIALDPVLADHHPVWAEFEIEPTP